MQPDLARRCAVRTEDRLRDLRPPCADQAAEAQDLALADREGHAPDLAAAKPLDFHHDLAQRHLPLIIRLAQRPADHLCNQTLPRHVRDIAGRDPVTVAQNSDAVTNVKYLLHAVGDKNDRNFIFLQLSDDPEQKLRLLARQRRRRLVQDQHLRVRHDGLDDLRQLLVCHAQVTDIGVRIHDDLHLVKFLLYGRSHRFFIDERAFHDLFAVENIFCNGQIRDQVELLIYRCDAAVYCLQRVQPGISLAIIDDLAGARFHCAGQHFDERRFSCAVFARQRMHLALAEVERHMIQRVDARVVFTQVSDFEYVLLHRLPP